MNKKTKTLKILLSVCMVITLSGLGIFTTNKFVKAKEPNKIIPLKTVEARKGLEDLKPLETILKDKKIIAMGEATHGSKEFFQMKHRMFEFLVENMGYRLFGIEASFGDCTVVNDYVLYGKGNAKDAINAMRFWTWSTKEVEDMVQWMREYNKNPKHKTKVKFYGFDMQFCSKDKQMVLNYIKKVDIKSVAHYNKPFSKFNENNISSLNINDIKIVKNNVQSLVKLFEGNNKKYTLKSSKSEYDLIHHHLNIIDQFLDLQLNGRGILGNYSNCRDYYMAENVKWILDYEKQFGNNKIMLWAHNAHVSKKFPAFISMGQNLKKIFKDDLYVIGQEFYKGGFRAVPYSILPVQTPNRDRLKNFNISRSCENTFAYKLNSFNIPICFIDFKQASTDINIKEYINKKQSIHEIGAIYSTIFTNMSNVIQSPNEAFDGVIFIKETHPAVGL